MLAEINSLLDAGRDDAAGIALPVVVAGTESDPRCAPSPPPWPAPARCPASPSGGSGTSPTPSWERVARRWPVRRRGRRLGQRKLIKHQTLRILCALGVCGAAPSRAGTEPSCRSAANRGSVGWAGHEDATHRARATAHAAAGNAAHSGGQPRLRPWTAVTRVIALAVTGQVGTAAAGQSASRSSLSCCRCRSRHADRGHRRTLVDCRDRGRHGIVVISEPPGSGGAAVTSPGRRLDSGALRHDFGGPPAFAESLTCDYPTQRALACDDGPRYGHRARPSTSRR